MFGQASAPDDKGDEECKGQEHIEAQGCRLVPVQDNVDPLCGGPVVYEHEDQVDCAIDQQHL